MKLCPLEKTCIWNHCYIALALTKSPLSLMAHPNIELMHLLWLAISQEEFLPSHKGTKVNLQPPWLPPAHPAMVISNQTHCPIRIKFNNQGNLLRSQGEWFLAYHHSKKFGLCVRSWSIYCWWLRLWPARRHHRIHCTPEEPLLWTAICTCKISIQNPVTCFVKEWTNS